MTESPDLQDLASIADRFARGASVRGVQTLGRGNINDTYRVTVAGGRAEHFVIQRINPRIFPSPEHVVENMRAVTEHMHVRLQETPFPERPGWRIPRLIPAEDGRHFWIGRDGSLWRAIEYIAGAKPLNVLDRPADGYEVGLALGTFHRLVSDLSTDRLFDTLPGFHVTPVYLQHFDQVQDSCTIPATSEVRYARQFILERRDLVGVLEDAFRAGTLIQRVIHGDPKYDNILLDEETGQAVAIVDLDTVKPGLLHYDIGDCLRSGCNPSGEDVRLWEQTRFDTGMARAILKGYLFRMRPLLSESDFAFLYDASRLIAFELGLRFFTDYLEGNVYFKVSYPEQNLYKALVQFQLTASIEKQEDEIRTLVQDLR